MIIKHDKKNKFMALFNPETGYYCRSGILSEGKDTGTDPFMADFPELIDVGVMGHCTHGKLGLCRKAGVECYQNGLSTFQPNMSLENFRRIVKECKGRTFQFALGGRGDVDMHENFEELLKCCRENGIVPNFTTSGLGLNMDKAVICKKYCGAVAVSWYRQEHTLRAISLLLLAGVKTNIHYVLGNNSIDEAIERLENKDFPEGINAVVFLLHKPVGLGSKENVLKPSDERLKRFMKLIDENNYPFRIGFDSCSAPGLINMTHNLNPSTFDICEG